MIYSEEKQIRDYRVAWCKTHQIYVFFQYKTRIS